MTQLHQGIEWLCALKDPSLETIERSTLASYRLRLAPAIRAAKRLGVRYEFSDGNQQGGCGVVFVSKLDVLSDASRSERWLNYLYSAAGSGRKIVVDFTDNHLGQKTHASDFYTKALPIADLVVASSETLSNLAQKCTARTVIIEDPFEVPVIPPREKKNQVPTALWFGHASNIKYLQTYLTERYAYAERLKLIVITNAYPLPKEVERSLDRDSLAKLDIQVLPWDLKTLIQVAEISDFCILPTGVHDARKVGASSNRLITALALGLPTVADILPSYHPFARQIKSLDRAEDVDKVIQSPHAMFDWVSQAQKLIKDKYSMNSIEKSWSLALFDNSELSKPFTPGIRHVNTGIKCQVALEILVITYNQLKFCDLLIENLRCIACANIKVSVSDDRSTDGTYETLRSAFKNSPYVSVRQNHMNLGPTLNFAALLSQATGDYILGIGGDDFCSPHSLRNILPILQNGAHEILVCKALRGPHAEVYRAMKVAPQDYSKNLQIKNQRFFDRAYSTIDFFWEIATVPGAIWGQGSIIKTDLLKSTGLALNTDVDDWGIFHNIALRSISSEIKLTLVDTVIAGITDQPGSRGSGSQVIEQLQRQLNAVMQHWHPKFKKAAMLNVIIKKSEQLKRSKIDAEDILKLLSTAFKEASTLSRA